MSAEPTYWNTFLVLLQLNIPMSWNSIRLITLISSYETLSYTIRNN